VVLGEIAGAATRPAEEDTREASAARAAPPASHKLTDFGLIDDRLNADDVVHQSLGDRLLHGCHSELALGVLGVKDHRSPADADDFRRIQSALSASCPLQAGPLALSQTWASR